MAATLLPMLCLPWSLNRTKPTDKVASLRSLLIDRSCNRLHAEVHATKAKAQGPDEKVVRLTEMGFDAQAAQAALFSANGDEQVSEGCGGGIDLTSECGCRRLCFVCSCWHPASTEA